MSKSDSIQKCKENSSKFCFVCTEYMKTSLRKTSKFNATYQAKYKMIFGVKNIKNLNKPYSGSSICRRCSDGLNKAVKKDGKKFYLSRPTIWLSPGKKHVTKKCFTCSTHFLDEREFNGKKILNVQLPLERSSNKKTPKLDEQDSDDDEMYVYKRSNRKDEEEVNENDQSILNVENDEKSSDIENQDCESEI